MNRVYLSSDDSNLLRGVLQGYSGECALEIGAGNGGNLPELSKRFGLVVGTDLVRPEFSKGIIIADRAGCFREAVFDLVAFNPPYLPSARIEDLAVDGGRDGVEVALSFLEEAVRVLKPAGKIVMLVSSENPIEELKGFCDQKGLGMALVASKALFYERLFVYVVERVLPPR